MRVMILGASTNPAKFGHKAVLAYQRQNHTVLPVNPNAATIAGIPAYPDIASVPGPIDRVTVYLPPTVGITLLPEIAALDGIDELWLNPGAESPELIAAAKDLGLEPIVACSIIDIGEHP